MKKPICRNCEFWTPEDEETRIPSGFGHAPCHHPRVGGDTYLGVSRKGLDSLNSYEAIGTGPEFGCIHFELGGWFQSERDEEVDRDKKRGELLALENDQRRLDLRQKIVDADCVLMNAANDATAKYGEILVRLDNEIELQRRKVIALEGNVVEEETRIASLLAEAVRLVSIDKQGRTTKHAIDVLNKHVDAIKSDIESKRVTLDILRCDLTALHAYQARIESDAESYKKAPEYLDAIRSRAVAQAALDGSDVESAEEGAE